MSVIQAALIALLYAFARSAFTFGLGRHVFSQPLVAGFLAGALLGDPARGAALGGAINLATLALSIVKLPVNPDIALIGYVGVPLLLLRGLPADSAQTAALLGALASVGLVLNAIRGLGNTLFAHWADAFAEQGNINLVGAVAVLPTQALQFMTAFLPALLLLRLDLQVVVDLVSALPAWVQSALRVSQLLIAALGIAMSLWLMMQGSGIAYFVLGWLGSQWLGPVPAVMLGASIAAVHAYLARKRVGPNHGRDADSLISDALPSDQYDDELESPQSLTAGQLLSSFGLWTLFHDVGLNIERGQNLGVVAALAPVGNQLWRSVDARTAFLRRHLTLFSSEWVFGGYVIGAAAALEERRANGDVISDGEFVGAKTSVMTAVSALGETAVLSLVTSILVALGAQLAQFSLLGPILFVIAESAIVLALAYLCFMFGYLHVRNWATWARSNDWLRAGLFGVVRVGACVLGTLLLTSARLQLPASMVMSIGPATVPLYALPDRIAPGLAPLLITLWLWWRLRYRESSPVSLLILCLAAAFVVCFIFKLAGWL